MNSYYGMGVAAEVRMHQLLDEVEHHRLIRGIEQRHDSARTRVPLRARIMAALQRLGRRGQPIAARPVAEGR
jgi:hypothetical protein